MAGNEFDPGPVMDACRVRVSANYRTYCVEGREDKISEEKDGQKVVRSCIDAQDRALDELDLWIENDQALYYNYPNVRFGKAHGDATRSAIEIGTNACEGSYHPYAEAKIKELRKKTGDQAKDIANSLFRPFEEQYVEIPQSKRQRWFDVCTSAVRNTVQDYDRCLVKRWNKQEP